MDTEGRKWLIGGVVLLLLLSALMRLADDTTPLIPVPYHQFVLWYAVSYGYLAFLPLVYGVTLRLLWAGERFRSVTLASSGVFCVLTAGWFWRHWESGLDYPGQSFTRGVALENAAGIAILLALAVLGYVRRERRCTAAAHLLLFALLAWCAFPLLWRADF